MYAYTLFRSSRKTLALQVTADAGIVVRAPARLPVSAIDAFVAKHEAWIARQLQRREEAARLSPPLTPERIAALREAARGRLPAKVASYGAQMGLQPAGLKVTSAGKRLGSCSGENRLCFSYRLMQYPDDVIDYVVVHELAHIRHHNHSRAFYALIEQILPDYRERWARLKATPAR